MPLPQAVATHPDKAAHVMAATGEQVTFAELDDRSRRFANVLAAEGIGPGDVVAVLMENHLRWPEVYWGIVRLGALVTPVNRHLTPEEVTYILEDSGARALVVTNTVLADGVSISSGYGLRLVIGGATDGFDSYEDRLAAASPERPAVEPMGDFMNYSSGTTGRPKGVRRTLADRTLDEPSPIEQLFTAMIGLDDQTVYLSTAPLSHSAPLATTMAVQARGGTAVIMERFDPAGALAAIAEHRITHSQWVPTMFVRLLRLDAAERAAHDLSSHEVAVHAAAPCPPDIKRQMLEWWGPIVREYYGGTELNGATTLTAEEWLEHPGSVGRAIIGTVHICDADTGEELPADEDGLVYFEREGRTFEYHNDPVKTKGAEHPAHRNWTTLGDIGHLDTDGYLYLTDRAAFTIISGGINVYPQEIENVLITHPSVADVAVIGVPDDEMGQRIHAVVQLGGGTPPSDDLARDLEAHARRSLAGFKIPRSIEFVESLPRLDNGKLYKRALLTHGS